MQHPGNAQQPSVLILCFDGKSCNIFSIKLLNVDCECRTVHDSEYDEISNMSIKLMSVTHRAQLWDCED